MENPNLEGLIGGQKSPSIVITAVNHLICPVMENTITKFSAASSVVML